MRSSRSRTIEQADRIALFQPDEILEIADRRFPQSQKAGNIFNFRAFPPELILR